MPLYYDPGYGYYTSSSYSAYTPYYVTNTYSPYTSGYSRPLTSNYFHTSKRSNLLSSSRYKPKLTPISETQSLSASVYHHSSLTPLTRIQSPKISPYRASPKYTAPRPIPINTADIDVSATKYQRRRRNSDEDESRSSTKSQKFNEENRSSVKSQKSTGSDDSIDLEYNNNSNINKNDNYKSPFMPRVDGTDPGKIRSTIKRNRHVVRLSTVRGRSKSIKKSSTQKELLNEKENINTTSSPFSEKSLQTNFFDDNKILLNTKDPTRRRNSSEINLERFYIPEEGFEKSITSQPEVDPLSLRRFSLSKCPSFHEICEDISSDKIDDDLNAGELRRRASLIQEQEIEILNQLQKSGSGTFQLILERNESQEDCRKSIKRKSGKKVKKIRHKITATVNVENQPLTPILQEVPEENFSPTAVTSGQQPKISYEVEEIKEEQTVHKVFKLPKKKIKVGKTGSKKGDGSKRESKEVQESKYVIDENALKEISSKEMEMDASAKTGLSENIVTGPEHFTFDIETVNDAVNKKSSVKSLKNQKSLESPMKSIEPIKTKSSPNITVASKTENYPKTPDVQLMKTATSAQLSQASRIFSKTKTESTDSGFGELKSPTTPKETKNIASSFAKPKPIVKLQKSESGEDFWGQIETRESLYMANRKKQLKEQQIGSNVDSETGNSSYVSRSVDDVMKENIVQVSDNLFIDNNYKRSESNDSVFCKSKLKDIKDKINFSEKNLSRAKSTDKMGTEASIIKSFEPNEKLEYEHQKKKENLKSLTPVTPSTITSTVNTTKLTDPKINSGLSAKTPEIKNKQNTKSHQIPSLPLEEKSILSSSEESHQKDAKIHENDSEKDTNTLADASTITKLAPKIMTTDARDATKCSASKKSGKLENQEMGATSESSQLLTSDNTTTKAITATKTITKSTKEMKISDSNDKNETKDNDDKNKTIGTGSQKVNESKITGSSKNSTKRLNDQKSSSEKVLTNALKKNDKKLNEMQPSSLIQEQQKKSAITPSPTVTDNQTQKLSEKTTNFTNINVDNKNRPNIGTDNNDAGTKPTVQINETIVASDLSSSIATIKEFETQDTSILKSNDQEDKKILSKYETVSNLNRYLLDVDADLSDFIPPESEGDNSSYEEDSSCEEFDENGMKKKNKHGKKNDEEQQPPAFNPNKVVKLDHTKKCYVKDEPPPFPLIAKPRPLWKPEIHKYRKSDSNSESDDSESDSECSSSDEFSGDDLNPNNSNNNGITSLGSDIRMSTSSNDSGFEGGTAPSSPKKMLGKSRIKS